MGTIKGVGRIYQQTFIDTYSRVTFAKLYDGKHAITSADLSDDRVLPFFEEQQIPLLRILTDRGNEYKKGKYCTLAHVIELALVAYSKLLSILRTDPQIEVLIIPFVSACLNDAMEQLEGQMASAKIILAKLASPQLYYVLSGNDFTLDINNPD